MNLNITKDQWQNETHTGPVFPGAEDRQYAYEGERVFCRMSLEIHADPPRRDAGKENRDIPETKYSHYELIFERHTGTQLSISLVGHRKDIVEQRKANGKAIMRDVLLTGIQFGELVNRIFVSAQAFHETEAFPDSIREAMKSAYTTA